jgi:hypothetical protein
LFTAKDDNTVGETISGSSGSPAGYYGTLSLLSGGGPVSGARFSYAATALSCTAPPTLNNVQFTKCRVGVCASAGTIYINNALFSDVNTNFLLIGSVVANNVTFNNVSAISGTPYAGYSVSLQFTNCVFANVTNMSGTIAAAANNGFYRATTFGNAWITNTFYPFQQMGAAGFYLTNGCSFLNAGTTNVDSNLLAALKTKTTYPPIVYSNTTISIPMTFSPQAQRDTDTPDLGYHYDPLDYVFGAVIAKSNLTFTAGTAAGWFYNSSGGTYGLAMGDNAAAIFNGTVTAPCRWSKYSMVQEGGNGLWKAQSWLGGITGQSYSQAAPVIRAQFTICTALNNEGNIFRDNGSLLNINATDCEFWGPCGGYYASYNFTNCLFANGTLGLWQNYSAANMTLWNCTLIGGDFTSAHNCSTNWPVTIMNCAFAGTAINMYSDCPGNTNGAICDYNAFLANSNRLAFKGPHDVIVTNFNWRSSWLGDYYLPTNSALIDAGNTNANLVGLYHFTTQTNQMKEANSVVDIGYHYVAVDANGNPDDTDGDGIPDYLEDANGNGVYDTGDLSDWLINAYNGLSQSSGLLIFTPLK